MPPCHYTFECHTLDPIDIVRSDIPLLSSPRNGRCTHGESSLETGMWFMVHSLNSTDKTTSCNSRQLVRTLEISSVLSAGVLRHQITHLMSTLQKTKVSAVHVKVVVRTSSSGPALASSSEAVSPLLPGSEARATHPRLTRCMLPCQG